MSDDLLARARAALENADPYVPWEADDVAGDGSCAVYAADSLKAKCTDRRTAEFIVAARALMPELVAKAAAIERVEELARRLLEPVFDDSMGLIGKMLAQELFDTLGGRRAMDSPWRRVLEALPVGSVVDFVVGGQVNHTVIRCESGGAGAGGFSILSGRDWLSVASWPDEVPDSTLRVVLDRSREGDACPE